MKMLNRTVAPDVKDISEIDYILPEKWTLGNGIPVWGIKAGSQELVKIDISFDAGAWYQEKNLVAGLTNSFMNLGSANYSAQQIAEAFDFRGAYLNLNADQQFGNISILTLTKYLEDILKVTSDLISHPQFPEQEVRTHLAKRKQQFIVENNKVKTLAMKKFSQVLFGSGHPYSINNTAADFDEVMPEDLLGFHDKFYTPERCRILIAGNYEDSIKDQLETLFGNDALSACIPEPEYSIQSSDQKRHYIEKKDSVQSAIRIGRQVVNRDHADFHGLTILITILGGYFGSRLMSSIREDKGYTYGIGAAIIPLTHASYLTIMTEVGNEVCRPAIEQIYAEFKKLIDYPVTDNELETVRNYLLGEMLRNFDGVFALSGSQKTLIESGLDHSFYQQYLYEVKTITPERLQKLAALYLQPSDMYEVVAG